MPHLPIQKKPEINPHIIETSRLLLKELNPGIWNELFTAYTDEDIISFIGLSGQEELEVEKANWRQGMTTYRISFKLFLMVEKETGAVIGKCGFHNWYALHQRAELGYTMIAEAEKRKGYMKEALEAVIRHGFEQMKLNRIEAFVGPENVPSLKLVKGYGFTEEGTLRSHYFKNGTIHDSVCFSLLKGEYEDSIRTTKSP